MLTSTQDFAANPFAMLLDPERVAHEVACSERLARLRSRVYRPLDKPLIAHRGAADQASFDEMIDATELSEEDLLPLDDEPAIGEVSIDA
ncbi:hypothetical protein [Roseateles chitosanitabidus]|jgi:hypothetical protein|uniref:hypothetical protein n=1 Tax=Roseateles chitosanitabidus TaxID=65048 RepID=UPI00082C5218|nr:hypothetical protein [Roseateles chitosanitabidus]MBO9687792.1 hypothetical protein [Roseateles chitosanitabidus]